MKNQLFPILWWIYRSSRSTHKKETFENKNTTDDDYLRPGFPLETMGPAADEDLASTVSIPALSSLPVSISANNAGHVGNCHVNGPFEYDYIPESPSINKDRETSSWTVNKARTVELQVSLPDLPMHVGVGEKCHHPDSDGRFDSSLPAGALTEEGSIDTVLHHAFLAERFENLKNQNPMDKSESASWFSSPSVSSMTRSSTRGARTKGFPVLQDSTQRVNEQQSTANEIYLSLPVLRYLQGNTTYVSVAKAKESRSDIDSLPPPPPPPLYSD